MAEHGYADYLEELYQGEVFGEAFFGAMAAARSDPEEAEKLAALEQLERETKELLVSALREAGRVAEPDAAKIEQGGAIGAQLGQAPWRDLLAGMRPELVRFVEEFRNAESLAPAGREAVLQHVTAHEQALLDFTDAELSGTGASDSLASVRQLLGRQPD